MSRLIIRTPSLLAYGVLSLLLGMALFVTGSTMTNPQYEQFGYLLSEVFTLFCLVGSVVFTFVMRSNKGASTPLRIYGLALAVSIVLWASFGIQQPFSDSDRVLMGLVALHGLFWGSRCVSLATHSATLSARSLLLVLIGATASSAGIFLATRSGLTKLEAVTTAACYMIGMALQLFFVSLLLHRGRALQPATDDSRSRASLAV